MNLKLAVCLLALAMGSQAVVGCGQSSATSTWRPIEISVEPAPIRLTSDARPDSPPVGFTYRGAVRLTSPDAGFGGVSDIQVFPDHSLLAITDRGDWIRADMTLEPTTGLPTGLQNARMARMTDERAIPLAEKEDADAEDLAVLPDGRVAVSFEQNQVIRIYDVFGRGPAVAAVAGPPLAQTERLRSNRGLEAMTTLADGRLLLASELGVRMGPSLVWAVPIDAATPAMPITRVRPQLSYAVTALERLPNGDLLTLERQYLPNGALRVALVGWPRQAIEQPGREIPRQYLAYVSNVLGPYGNYEGLSAVELPNDQIRIYIATDNNFAEEHATILSVFDWQIQPLGT
ncbi:MAG: esterase-like activity of phytase family protein [Caulobacterales bacterium]|jgi:hypothetical protein